MENLNGKWSRMQALFTVQHEGRGGVIFFASPLVFLYSMPPKFQVTQHVQKNAPDYFRSRDKDLKIFWLETLRRIYAPPTPYRP